MSNVAGNSAVIQLASPPKPEPATRGFIRTAVADTVKRTSARIGLAWIVTVVLAGVLAPVIANSAPILARDAAGRYSCPMLVSLDYADITLLVMFACVIALYLFRRHVPPLAGVAAFAGIVIACFGATYHLYPEKQAVVYSQYREALRSGTLSWMLPTVIPYSPSDRLWDYPTGQQNLQPSWSHLFGTTANAEDVLSRMLYASRVAVAVGFVATGIAVAVGVIIGGLMGYFVGVVDIIGMRLIEIFEAIPTLYLIIMFVTFYPNGRNMFYIMAIIGATSWTGNARFIRAEFLHLRNQDFVQAAIASGLRLPSILFRHMLPNGFTPVLISASFGVASAILTESYLSFLGLGVIDKPSWGQMLDQARGQGTAFYWWMAVFPGGAIFLTVFAYNLIGEAVRDALDPKLRERH
ncbi:hypothetical protein BH10PLA1_BH10PLA1_03070 [soil metagenome]